MLIQLHYVRILRAYQARGRIREDVDPVPLAELIVGITTVNFGRFVAREEISVQELLAAGQRHVELIMAGLLIAVPKRRRGT